MNKYINSLMRAYLFFFPLKFMRYHSYRIEKFVQSIALKFDKKGKNILDIGAENSPYKKYFKHIGYFTQDIKQNSTKTIDFVGDINGGLLNIKDESFDFILCTQVLEHIKNPDNAFKTFNRILKPGGKLFLTTHQCFEEHMIPYDYFRFTRYGLKFLGESSGFSLQHIAPHGGIFHVLALIIDTIPIKLFFKKGFIYYIYLFVFTIPILIFNIFCYILDFLDRDKIMTLNYECIYEKKIK